MSMARAWPLGAHLGGRMGTSRPFIDSFGFSWQAWEVGSADEPRSSGENSGDGGRRRLYFFSRGMTRVLVQYPSDWHLASWAELEDLCARALVLGADLGVRATRDDATVRSTIVSASLAK